MADKFDLNTDYEAKRRERRDEKTAKRREELRQQAADRSSGKPVRRRRRIKLTSRSKLILAVIILLFVLIQIIKGVNAAQTATDVYMSDKGFKHADRFSNCVALRGIDISEHNGDKIKWKKVKTSGADFVFIRAGYRGAEDGTIQEDACFRKNAKAAAKAGLMVGAYFYSQALTPAEAEEEADFLINAVKSYDITMPLVIDYEIFPDGRLDKKIKAGEMYAASFYHDIVLAFCKKVHAAGYESAVYANYDMLTNYMDASILDDEATIWLARYNKRAGLDANYSFWQCSDKAKVGGIEGKVDQNYWYVEPEKIYKTKAAGVNEKNRISINNCHISFQRSVTKLKNRRAIPKLGITFEGRGIKEGRDYILSVVRNTAPDKGYIIVRGIGIYKNWMMVPFAIEGKGGEEEAKK